VSGDIKPNLDELTRRVENMVEKASQMVPLPELLHPEFMKAHTKFSSLEEMGTASGLFCLSHEAEEMASIFRSPEWSEFVVANSSFASWDEMIKAAGVERFKKAFE
jgi:hypothetical protein